MLFSSIKEINSLLSKGMSSIYLKVAKLTFSKLWYSKFKKFISRPVFWELQLTKYHWVLKVVATKKSETWEQNCVAFLVFLFLKELWRFKVKQSILFVEQKYKLLWKQDQIKNGKSHTHLQRDEPCALARNKNGELEVKLRVRVK